MANIDNCIHCKSIKIVKNGKIWSSGQRFRCYDCNHDFSIWSKRWTISPIIKRQIVIKFCHDHISVRKLSTEFEVATSSIISRSKWHKKECKICSNESSKDQA